VRIGYFAKDWAASDFFGSHQSVVQALRRLGHEVRIVTIRARPQPRLTVEESEADGLPVFAVSPGRTPRDRFGKWLGSRWLDAPLYGVAHEAFRRFLDRHDDLDLLHVEFVWPFGLAAVRAARGQPPVVVTPQGNDIACLPEAQFGSGRFPLVRRRLRDLFRRVEGVRAIAPMVADQVCTRYGADPARVHLVRRSIADGCYPDPAADLAAHRTRERSAFLQRHGLGDGPLLVAVCRVMPVKGIADMLRAAAQMRETLPGVRLAIAGETRVPGTGDYARRMLALAESLGLNETVRFLGHLPHAEIPGALAAADLFVSTTIEETTNKAIAEAAAVGTPAVFTDGHGIVAYLEGRGCSRIVPGGDHRAVAAAALEVLTDPHEWSAMSRRCVEAAEEFRADAVAPQLIATYQQVLARP